MARSHPVARYRTGPGRVPMSDPLAGFRLAVPAQVRARSGRVEWRGELWPGEEVGGVLSAFLALSDETRASAFAAFAGRFGVLGLDATGAPHTASGELPPDTGDGSDAWFTERIAHWRVYAQHAKAVVTLAHALRRGDRVNPASVLAAVGLWPAPEPQSPGLTGLRPYRLSLLVHSLNESLATGKLEPRSGERQREWLANYVSRTWLASAALVPRIVWQGDEEPRVTLVSGHPYLSPGWQMLGTAEYLQPLFGALALGLADAICDGRALIPCQRCGAAFAPSHQRQVYCAPCQPLREREAATASQGRRRQRRKAEQAVSMCTPTRTPTDAETGEQGRTFTDEKARNQAEN